MDPTGYVIDDKCLPISRDLYNGPYDSTRHSHFMCGLGPLDRTFFLVFYRVIIKNL